MLAFGSALDCTGIPYGRQRMRAQNDRAAPVSSRQRQEEDGGREAPGAAGALREGEQREEQGGARAASVEAGDQRRLVPGVQQPGHGGERREAGGA